MKARIVAYAIVFAQATSRRVFLFGFALLPSTTVMRRMPPRLNCFQADEAGCLGQEHHHGTEGFFSGGNTGLGPPMQRVSLRQTRGSPWLERRHSSMRWA